jgi:hypothetical protein
MSVKYYALVLLFLFLGWGQSPAQAQYLHPKLAPGKQTIRNVVILPPKVDVVKQSIKGTESMIEESEAISKIVNDIVAQALQAKKINIVNSPFAQTGAETGDDRKYALADIQGRYDALLPKMVKNPKDVKKARFSLGDEVLSLNVDKSVDAVVFIRGQGMKVTKGKQIFGLLNPLSLSIPAAFITIGVVDAHTGEVLAFAKPLAIGDVVGNSQKMLSKPITKSLKKLPDAP